MAQSQISNFAREHEEEPGEYWQHMVKWNQNKWVWMRWCPAYLAGTLPELLQWLRRSNHVTRFQVWSLIWACMSACKWDEIYRCKKQTWTFHESFISQTFFCFSNDLFSLFFFFFQASWTTGLTEMWPLQNSSHSRWTLCRQVSDTHPRLVACKWNRSLSVGLVL